MNLIKQLPVLLLFIFSAMTAQQPSDKPDYKLIKTNIENKSSNLYYKTLLGRLKSNDTLLTKDEYRHLYYGAALQKDYEPYQQSPNHEKLQKYYQMETLSEADRKAVIRIATESLEKFPLDLRVMDYLSYIYQQDGNEAMAKKLVRNMDGLVEAIMSTGDGLTCESAFHVLWVSNEYMLLSLFGMQNVGQSLVGSCDYLAFEKDKYKIKGLYFDVSKLFERNMEKFKD